MRVKALLLFIFLTGSYLFAQPLPLSLVEIKLITSSSTDIEKLVETVKSWNLGFKVKGDISEKGTAFSNGKYEFVISATRGYSTRYSETINNSENSRLSDLLRQLKADGFREDPKSKGSRKIMNNRPWAYLQNVDADKGITNITIVYTVK